MGLFGVLDMKNINTKIFIYILVGISILIYLGILFLMGVERLKPADLILIIPKVAAIVVILTIIFSKWVWKWKIFYDWLIPYPNLNGTYKGFIHSTWIDKDTNKRPDPIPCILCIKQSFVNISCVIRTAEMTSYSFGENFEFDKENQIKRLSYSYDSNPKNKVRDRSSKHSGTIIYSISEQPFSLTGEYWTERKTTGDIELSFWKKNIVDKYPDELDSHPSKNGENQ